MVKRKLVSRIIEGVTAKPRIGMHASPVKNRKNIRRKGLVQGENVAEPEWESRNPRGVQFIEINGTYVRKLAEEGEVGKLYRRLEASVRNAVKSATRHGTKEFDLYLFDSVKAREEHPENITTPTLRGFRKVKLYDLPEKPVRVTGLTRISIDDETMNLIRVTVNNQRENHPSPSKRYGNIKAHVNREITRYFIKKILEFYKT